MQDTAVMCIMKDWVKEAGIKSYKETIAYHICGDSLYVVTQSCGVMIGYRGALVDKYRELLKEKGYDLNIKFVDIFCGGVVEF